MPDKSKTADGRHLERKKSYQQPFDKFWLSTSYGVFRARICLLRSRLCCCPFLAMNECFILFNRAYAIIHKVQAHFSNFHSIRTTAVIPTSFCVMTKTFKYSQIQDGSQRPSWKKMEIAIFQQLFVQLERCIHHMTFLCKDVPFGGYIDTAAQIWIGVFKPNVQIIQTFVLTKLLQRFKPILQNHKDIHVLFTGGRKMYPTNLRWRIATILKKKDKLLYFSNILTTFDKTLRSDAYWPCKL